MVHYHSGIGYLQRVDVHAGDAEAIVADRQAVLDAALRRLFRAVPLRPARHPPGPLTEAGINKPSIQTKTA